MVRCICTPFNSTAFYFLALKLHSILYYSLLPPHVSRLPHFLPASLFTTGGCNRWVHQLCALFNGRRNISDAVAYVCPICLTDKRRCGSSGEQIIASADTNRKMAAVDLPQTTLTRFLEERIEARLALAYSEAAEKSGISVDNVEKCPNLSLRLVSSYDKSHIVREGTYSVFYSLLCCLIVFINASSPLPLLLLATVCMLCHAESCNMLSFLSNSDNMRTTIKLRTIIPMIDQ